MFSSNFIIAQYVPFVLMWRRLLYIGFESNALLSGNLKWHVFANAKKVTL